MDHKTTSSNKITVIYDSIQKTIIHLESYISTLSSLLSVSFSSDETSSKKAYANYRKLTAELLKIKDSADSANAALSLCICDADSKMDTDALNRYLKIFEKYEKWSKSLILFMQSSENEFKLNMNNLKISVILSHAQLFLNSSKAYKLFLNDSQEGR